MKKALVDFKRAAAVAPRDPDLRKKLEQCEREVKRIRFEEALATPVRSHCPGKRRSGSVTAGQDLTAMLQQGSVQDPAGFAAAWLTVECQHMSGFQCGLPLGVAAAAR